MSTEDRNNTICDVNTTIAMEYPHSINMIKVKLATKNTNSFMHLTRCLQDILKDQYKLISIDKANESNSTAAIYIKPGDTAVTVVEKGVHNCYTSILLICYNTNTLATLHKQNSASILYIILITFLSTLALIVTILVIYLIKRYISNKKKTEPVETRNDTDDTTYTAWFDYLESKDPVNTKKNNKTAHTRKC